MTRWPSLEEWGNTFEEQRNMCRRLLSLHDCELGKVVRAHIALSEKDLTDLIDGKGIPLEEARRQLSR